MSKYLCPFLFGKEVFSCVLAITLSLSLVSSLLQTRRWHPRVMDLRKKYITSHLSKNMYQYVTTSYCRQIALVFVSPMFSLIQTRRWHPRLMDLRGEKTTTLFLGQNLIVAKWLWYLFQGSNYFPMLSCFVSDPDI